MTKVLTPAALDVCCALSVEVRLRLVEVLLRRRRELTVGELADEVDVSLSMVSRHLRALDEAGLLLRRKEGRQVFYRLPGTRLAHLLRQIADRLERCCP